MNGRETLAVIRDVRVQVWSSLSGWQGLRFYFKDVHLGSDASVFPARMNWEDFFTGWNFSRKPWYKEGWENSCVPACLGAFLNKRCHPHCCHHLPLTSDASFYYLPMGVQYQWHCRGLQPLSSSQGLLRLSGSETEQWGVSASPARRGPLLDWLPLYCCCCYHLALVCSAI